MGIWNSFKEIENNKLQRLAASLPISVLQCKETSTTRKYIGVFKALEIMGNTTHNISAFPANSAYIALYLQHQVKSRVPKPPLRK